MLAAKAVIANGASLSGSVRIGGHRIVAIEMPAGWTAAALTFQGSLDGDTFNNFYDEAGAEISITVAASRFIGLDAAALELSGVEYLKVRSGTSGAPVNQGAERTILLAIG